MLKTIQIIVMATLCLNFNLSAQEPGHQSPQVKVAVLGKVISAHNGEPLLSAVVKVAGTGQTALTDNGGVFTLVLPKGKYSLVVSYLTHKIKRIEIEVPLKDKLLIAIEPEDQQLKEVEIVSTGYQSLPKERATGSFEVVDNKLFNRSTGTDVFSRLDGVTTGTLFLKSNTSLIKTPFEGLLIRGFSAVGGARPPLIVLDNFPYDGSPNNLNPNDVESVTLLKDAAAASIWGSQAGNGVIVIKTKKGGFNQPFQVSLNSNVTFTDKPDLKYLKTISSSDFIDVEKTLFANGYYDRYLNPKYPFLALSPVVELLAKQSNGDISEADANAQIDAFRKQDVRDDFLKYVYRVASKQQHALTISGGDRTIAYLLSAGYDKKLDNIKTSDYERKTFRFNTLLKPIDHLEVEAGALYVQTKERLTSSGSVIQYNNMGLIGDLNLYPYARLADQNGNPLAIANGFRTGFTDTIGRGALLDWKYKPLEEMNQNANISRAQSLLLNAGLKYNFSPVFNAELKYQYEKGNTTDADNYGKDSFYARHRVNLYTQFQDGIVTYQPVPYGDVVRNFNTDFTAQGIRGQLNFAKTWQNKHQLNVIAGTEVRENISGSNGNILYGYDAETLTYTNVDFVNAYPLINGSYGRSTIQSADAGSLTKLTNRYVSLFTNAAYAYDNRYLFSISARKDEANLMGLASNAKGLPLWSAGTGWNISNESFYNSSTLPYLKLRATYGQSGNVDNSVPAVATISYSPATDPTNFPYAVGNNPPNSKLRFEKVAMLNFGLDYGFKNNWLTGSLEYYIKRSTDLIAPAPVDPSTGFQTLIYNSAITQGKGLEAQIHAKTFSQGDFSWNTDLLFSYNRPIVKRYLLAEGRARDYVLSSGSPNPIAGKDIWGMYAFRFAGLDHDTGKPIGFLNGAESMDYYGILNKSKVADLQYFGSSKPLYYGAFRNTFNYRGFALSVNLSYRFAYWVRRSGMDYNNLVNLGFGHSDYTKRWQKPGDESSTNVPAFIYGDPDQYNNSYFYNYSSALVVKGDNIRLEDMNLSYTFQKAYTGVKMLRVYCNANNLGMIWKANKAGIDPDYGFISNQIPPSRTLVFGASINF